MREGEHSSRRAGRYESRGVGEHAIMKGGDHESMRSRQQKPGSNIHGNSPRFPRTPVGPPPNVAETWQKSLLDECLILMCVLPRFCHVWGGGQQVFRRHQNPQGDPKTVPGSYRGVPLSSTAVCPRGAGGLLLLLNIIIVIINFIILIVIIIILILIICIIVVVCR